MTINELLFITIMVALGWNGDGNVSVKSYNNRGNGFISKFLCMESIWILQCVKSIVYTVVCEHISKHYYCCSNCENKQDNVMDHISKLTRKNRNKKSLIKL